MAGRGRVGGIHTSEHKHAGWGWRHSYTVKQEGNLAQSTGDQRPRDTDTHSQCSAWTEHEKATLFLLCVFKLLEVQGHQTWSPDRFFAVVTNCFYDGIINVLCCSFHIRSTLSSCVPPSWIVIFLGANQLMKYRACTFIMLPPLKHSSVSCSGPS